jgi:hypothetical protein
MDLTSLFNALWEFRYFVLIILFAISFLALLGWQNMKVLLYQLMLQAKRLAKDAILHSGQQQEEWVVTKAIQFMPISLRIFLNEDAVRKIIKWLYNKAKDYADDGIVNNSIK